MLPSTGAPAGAPHSACRLSAELVLSTSALALFTHTCRHGRTAVTQMTKSWQHCVGPRGWPSQPPPQPSLPRGLRQLLGCTFGFAPAWVCTPSCLPSLCAAAVCAHVQAGHHSPPFRSPLPRGLHVFVPASLVRDCCAPTEARTHARDGRPVQPATLLHPHMRAPHLPFGHPLPQVPPQCIAACPTFHVAARSAPARSSSAHPASLAPPSLQA